MLFRRFAWSVLITAFLIGFVPARLSAQGGCTFTFSPGSGSPSAAGGNFTVQVTASSSSCVRPVPVSNDTWITISFGGGTGNGSFGYTILPNTSVVARSGSISHGNQIYVVNQAANTCSFSLSATTSSFGGAGGNGSFSVIPSASECSWTASTSFPWIHVNTASGTGNGAVSFSVDQNPTGVARSGLIVAGGVTHTVNQTGSCVFTVTPTIIQAPAAGVQAGTIDINASLASCAWTVTGAPGWLTITFGDKGTGNGTVGYSITPNTTATERTDTFTVAGVPVTVTQAGQGACTIALSQTEIAATPYASTGSIIVTAVSGCTWTAVSNATWLTISSGASGNGAGTVNYSIAANTTGQSRFATLTIGGVIVPVTQPAQACSMVIYPFAFSIGADGGAGTFNVTAASTCVWSPVSGNIDWIQVTSKGPGAGNGAASFVAFPNPSTNSRTGSIAVGSQVVTVTQAGQTCSIRLTANGATSFAPGGGTGAFAISARDDCSWTVTTNASWITITRGAAGSGEDSGAYSVAANTGPTSRTGVILAGGSAIQVTQAGTVCTVALAPASAGYPAAGGEGSIAVTSPCAWTATTPANWIVLTAPASGTGDGRLVYSVRQNTTTQSRSSSITIADATFPVTQSAGSCSYALSPTSGTITRAGGDGSFKIASSSGCQWTPASSASWLKVVSWADVSGTGTVSYRADFNPSGVERTGTITVAGQTFTLVQAVGGPVITKAGVANAASFTAGAVAPGEIIAIFGLAMGPEQPVSLALTPDGQYVTSGLAGTRATFDGVAAPITFTSAGQVNVVVPYEVAGKTTTELKLEYNGAVSEPVTLDAAAVSPAIFTLDTSGKGPGAILNQDYKVNSAANAAARGSTVMIFATGEGATRPAGENGKLAAAPLAVPVADVSVKIGGQDAIVRYKGGAPGLVAGVIQINVVIPTNIQPNNNTPIVFSVGGVSAPAGVTVAVR